jgi:hypothetical protein
MPTVDELTCICQACCCWAAALCSLLLLLLIAGSDVSSETAAASVDKQRCLHNGQQQHKPVFPSVIDL